MAVRKTKKGLALKRWFKEDWRTPKGNKDYSKGESTFRPTKRVTKDTPSTWSELTPYEKAAAKKEKREKKRVSRYKKKAGGKVEKFKPHMMYDPKTGKGYKANKMADHNRMNKKGYKHTKPKMKMGGNKTNDADVLKFFNDRKEARAKGLYMDKGGEPTQEKKKTLKDKFYDSDMYAGHVRRVLKRNMKKRERRANPGPEPLFKTPEGYQRQYKRRKKRKDRKKAVKNYFAAGKQRRQNRKAKRSNAGIGGGEGCVMGKCS